MSAVELLQSYWPQLLFAGALSYFYFKTEDRKNLPPGPRGLPIVGYIPFLGDYGHLKLIELAKKYGNVIFLKLGSNEVVILNDITTATEAYGKETMAMRPNPSLFTLFASESGLTNWENEIWRDHRRFALRTLRNLGVGKPEMESLISEEIEYFVSKLEDYKGKPVPIRTYLAPSASNIVFSVLVGLRYNYDHPTRKMLDLLYSFQDMPSLPITGYISNFVSVMKVLISPFTSKFRERRVWFNKFFQTIIEEHEEKFDRTNPRDLMEAYMVEVEDKKSPYFAKDKLRGICGDMLGAGSGTVKDSVEWLLLNVTLNEDIQKKIHSEIDDVIGRERRPTYADRATMPYTQAVIHEAMRHGSLLPMNLPHIATEDTTIGGYNIPKGTHILVNFWAIHRDPNYWPNAELFDPTRFLNEDGTKLVKKESFIPFSSGKRSCPGEQLAQVEMFLYVTHIFQKFRLEKAGELTTEIKLNGFSLVPKKPLELVFKLR